MRVAGFDGGHGVTQSPVLPQTRPAIAQVQEAAAVTPIQRTQQSQGPLVAKLFGARQ
jgi:hypothetical protein